MKRHYPDQYSQPIRRVLDAVTFSTPNVVGSAADRQVLYSADYDLVERVNLSSLSPRLFQTKIAMLDKLCVITDIKAGVIERWMLCDGHYSQAKELGRLEDMKGILAKEEHALALRLLKPSLTPLELLEARKHLRFGLVRWSVEDVKRGHVVLRDGEKYTLADAFRAKLPTKIDVLAWTGSLYIEVSNVVLWTHKGRALAASPPILQSLREDAAIYLHEGNYLKVLKRMYSISKQIHDGATKSVILDILNDVGYLYALTADLEIVGALVEKGLKEHVQTELDSLKDRLQHVSMKPPSLSLLPDLNARLQAECREEMETGRLLPLPTDYRM